MKKKNDQEKYSKERKEMTSATHEDKAQFDLAEEAKQYVNLDMKDEDLGQAGNFLQKLHLRNHSVASKETIHEIYRTDEVVSENEPGFLSEADELIFQEVQRAISEHDVINLRSTLQFISKSISSHNYCSEEIEDFIEGNLDDDLNLRIKEESMFNANLADDIRLFKEINQAISENDIIQLRSNLHEIFDNESSHNHSIEEIDNFLSNELEEHEREVFEEELSMNAGLAKDVRIHKEINEAIVEKDIILLRQNLKRTNEAETRDDAFQKRGISHPKMQKIIWYAAASIILMIGFTFTIRNHTSSNAELYQEYFKPFESDLGVTRSASNSGESALNNALIKLNQKDFDTALKLFSNILKEDPNNAVLQFLFRNHTTKQGKL